MLIGPRNSVVAHLLNQAYDYARDISEWITFNPRDRGLTIQKYPELWVDRIHDYCGEEDVPD